MNYKVKKLIWKSTLKHITEFLTINKNLFPVVGELKTIYIFSSVYHKM